MALSRMRLYLRIFLILRLGVPAERDGVQQWWAENGDIGNWRQRAVAISPGKLGTGCYPDNDGRNKNRVKMKEAKPEGSYSPQGLISPARPGPI
jgi:hypothetical protein